MSPLSRSAPRTHPRRDYHISVRRDTEIDFLRLAHAVMIPLLIWLTSGLLALIIQSVHWPLIHDAPIMHYIAWQILHGGVPYRDILDMNLPGVYLLHILVLKVFGPSDGGWRLFDLVWLPERAGCCGSSALREGVGGRSRRSLSMRPFISPAARPAWGSETTLSFPFSWAGCSLP